MSYLRRLKDVQFTTSWRRLIYVVLKTPNLRRLEHIDLRRLQDIWFKTSVLRCLEDVQFTTYWRRLIYDVLRTRDLRRRKDVWFTSSWGRLIYDVLKASYLYRLEDVLFASSWSRPIYDVFKTPAKQRLCSNAVVRSIQRQKKCFFLIWYCLKYSENFKCSCLG